MRKGLLLSAFLLVVLSAVALVQSVWLRPDNIFDNYPANTWTGRIAPLSWKPDDTPELDRYVSLKVYGDFSDQPDATFEDVQRGYMALVNNREVRFADRYAILKTGCGTECSTGLLFDLETGTPVAQIPIFSFGLKFRSNSRLLVINPFEEGFRNDNSVYPVADRSDYYLWNDGEFVPSGQVLWPKRIKSGTSLRGAKNHLALLAGIWVRDLSLCPALAAEPDLKALPRKFDNHYIYFDQSHFYDNSDTDALIVSIGESNDRIVLSYDYGIVEDETYFFSAHIVGTQLEIFWESDPSRPPKTVIYRRCGQDGG
ncbi:hypothetical protein [Mesorhizobium sp. KR9-304]|uniref:hypothetical protein n=1 Tax=Mesorhizobium sp. KR9-304 TaxID=3156614 RepID=UPI0032B3A43A